jgi:non-canonical purine NTP pyrophosphatase (RdgB/HAM1 family)
MPLEGLVFVTSNPGKLREARRFLGVDLKAEALDLPEIQSQSFEEVVRAKAREAARRLGVPVLVEDSGLELHAWGGFPGPFTKWITMGALGQAGLAQMLDSFPDRRATAVSAFAVARPGQKESDILIATGRVDGHIAERPRGTNGFGWDVLFIPDGDTRTYAEMSGEEKDRDSHRARALTALRKILQPAGFEEKPA